MGKAMRLSELEKELKGHEGGADRREVFLLALVEKSTATDTAGGGSTTSVRDKDIWSLAGPLELNKSPSQFRVNDKELDDLVEELKAIERVDSGLTSGFGQELLILFHERERVRDKDIWSWTNPLPASSSAVDWRGAVPVGGEDGESAMTRELFASHQDPKQLADPCS